jgi:hypothetical protein
MTLWSAFNPDSSLVIDAIQNQGVVGRAEARPTPKWIIWVQLEADAKRFRQAMEERLN